MEWLSIRKTGFFPELPGTAWPGIHLSPLYPSGSSSVKWMSSDDLTFCVSVIKSRTGLLYKQAIKVRKALVWRWFYFPDNVFTNLIWYWVWKPGCSPIPLKAFPTTLVCSGVSLLPLREPFLNVDYQVRGPRVSMSLAATSRFRCGACPGSW